MKEIVLVLLYSLCTALAVQRAKNVAASPAPPPPPLPNGKEATSSTAPYTGSDSDLALLTMLQQAVKEHLPYSPENTRELEGLLQGLQRLQQLFEEAIRVLSPADLNTLSEVQKTLSTDLLEQLESIREPMTQHVVRGGESWEELEERVLQLVKRLGH